MKAKLHYYRHKSKETIEFDSAEEAITFATWGEDDGEFAADHFVLENGAIISNEEFSNVYCIWDDEKREAAITTLLAQKAGK